MGLLNARNLRKAKDLLDKNRHKVGDLVDKAGTKIDQVSGGKTSNVTSKAAEAAKKYSAGGVSHHGIDTPVQQPGQSGQYPASGVDPAAANAAAAAITNAANAAANLMNNPAVQAQMAEAMKQAEAGKHDDKHDDGAS
ncbi:MAG: antitoxin [Ilumatobacter sp.]|uniref:antitoxin n=1 Tax=Ilumatobacter sp. TaxID=1967498 RepID=UPI00391BAC2F